MKNVTETNSLAVCVRATLFCKRITHKGFGSQEDYISNRLKLDLHLKNFKFLITNGIECDNIKDDDWAEDGFVFLIKEKFRCFLISCVVQLLPDFANIIFQYATTNYRLYYNTALLPTVDIHRANVYIFYKDKEEAKKLPCILGSTKVLTSKIKTWHDDTDNIPDEYDLILAEMNMLPIFTRRLVTVN